MQYDVVIVFLLGFGKAMQYPSQFQKIWYEAQQIFKIRKDGNACALNSFGHEEYPTDSLNQNNLTRGIYKIFE